MSFRNILPSNSRINQHILMPPHCPKTLEFVSKNSNLEIIVVDTSEFNKIDGALRLEFWF
jgi:hypothetical protein